MELFADPIHPSVSLLLMLVLLRSVYILGYGVAEGRRRNYEEPLWWAWRHFPLSSIVMLITGVYWLSYVSINLGTLHVEGVVTWVIFTVMIVVWTTTRKNT